MKKLIVLFILVSGVCAYAEDIDTADIDQALDTLKADFNLKFKEDKDKDRRDIGITTAAGSASMLGLVYGYADDIDGELTSLHQRVTPYNAIQIERFKSDYARFGLDPNSWKQPDYTYEKKRIKYLNRLKNLRWLGPIALTGTAAYGIHAYTESERREEELKELADCYREISGGDIISEEFYETEEFVMFRIIKNMGLKARKKDKADEADESEK